MQYFCNSKTGVSSLLKLTAQSYQFDENSCLFLLSSSFINPVCRISVAPTSSHQTSTADFFCPSDQSHRPITKNEVNKIYTSGRVVAVVDLVEADGGLAAVGVAGQFDSVFVVACLACAVGSHGLVVCPVLVEVHHYLFPGVVVSPVQTAELQSHRQFVTAALCQVAVQEADDVELIGGGGAVVMPHDGVEVFVLPLLLVL